MSVQKGHGVAYYNATSPQHIPNQITHICSTSCHTLLTVIVQLLFVWPKNDCIDAGQRYICNKHLVFHKPSILIQKQAVIGLCLF